MCGPFLLFSYGPTRSLTIELNLSGYPMRLSEKSVELNFAAQASHFLRQDLFWFGLTQRQERRAGFDIATKCQGHIFLFQIKASNYVKENGARQFRTPHHQLSALQTRTSTRRGVYYLFPLFGSTHEIHNQPNILDRLRFLDVTNLPNPIPPPTVKSGSRLRKSGLHYVDVWSDRAVIHSDPIEQPLLQFHDLLQVVKSEPGGLWPEDLGVERFEALCSHFSGTALGVAAFNAPYEPMRTHGVQT